MDDRGRILIQPATVADLDALTELHCASFRPEEHVPVMLGRDYVRATYRWQVTDSRSYVLVARLDGQLAGLASVCEWPYMRPMFLACLPELAKSLIRRPSRIINRRLWGRLFRRPRNTHAVTHGLRVAYMVNGAVHEQHRGRGVFTELIGAAERGSAARGARVIYTGVYKTNNPARRAFDEAGWVEVPELETSETVCFARDLGR